MSMGMVLEGVRDWLRNRNGWNEIQCGVMDQLYPPPRAGQFYVAIDEDGAEAGPEDTEALTEVYRIEVAVWRRPGHLPKDYLDQMVVPEDRYIPELKTLHDLERRVIHWLHGKWEFRAYLNAKYGLPDSGRGDQFHTRLMFTGSSKRETITLESGTIYHGRKLRFRGLKRIQKLSVDLG